MTIQPNQFEVQPSSGVPIYRQIIDQIQAMIVGGHLPEGAMLPSVRETATALGVNPMTISKAYSRLEADGVLERVRGRGMVVRQRTARGNSAERLAELRPLAESAVVRGRQLDLSDDQILALIQKILQEMPR